MEKNEKDNQRIAILIFCAVVVAYFAIMSFSGCSTTHKPSQTVLISKPIESPKPIAILPPYSNVIVSIPTLSWENTNTLHPERKSWSIALNKYILEKFDSLDKAKDLYRFCPKYNTLNKDQKVKCISELFIAISYHESGYNPKVSEQDVGIEDDIRTWSQGLFSMSLMDQESYNIPLGFKGNDLLDPVKNIQLAVYIMSRQIDKCDLFIAPSRKYLYWVVLYESSLNRYDQTSDIIKRVQKNAYK